MKFTSTLTPEKYLTSLRMRMSGHADFNERFTGLFIGRCFHVTHHADYEWDRKYNSPKNAAVGYIKQTEEGCEIRFFLARGLLIPAQLISYFLIFTCALLIMFALNDFLEKVGTLTCIGLGLLATLPSACISALFESATERSQEGREALLALLQDPVDPYSHLR